MVIAAALVSSACHHQARGTATEASASPTHWRFAGAARPVVAPHAMVASNSTIATRAGVEILREGGNAVDAAVATGFALAVAYPEAGNLGGGGYMVIRMADGRAAALDFREVAPLAATRDMYVDSAGHVTDRSRIGPLASGVPGSVAGLTAALARYGTMPLARVMQPAIRLAADGFEVDSAFSRSLRSNRRRIEPFAGAGVFLPNGEPLAPGARLVQPALARTLRAIAEGGARAFYHGAVAESIAAELQREGGIITANDLAHYAPVWREPLRGRYRGHTLLAMPPSSSGGVTVLETLGILEARGAAAPAGSAREVHRQAEAFRRAFVDRNTKLGDPAFVHDPVDELTSAEYARKLASTIDSARATPTGDFAHVIGEGTQTTHYSVVDAQGNAVATTTTLNDLYGSGVYVASAGFFLNDEMDDFTSRVGVPNMYGLVQGEANAIAPGKRMLSAMSPTIVLDDSGRVMLVLGARGGPRIITSVAQVLLDVIDHGMSLAAALETPRIHHQAWPDSVWYENGGFSPAVLDSLTAMGHAIGPFRTSDGDRFVGRVIGIERTRDGWVGVVDPRTSGGAGGT